MKKLTKKLFLVALVAFVVAAAGTLQANDVFDKSGTFEKREEFRIKLEQMREEIKANGHTFTVDFNPAMQYPIEVLCNFRPELGIDTTDMPDTIIQGKPAPSPTSYIAAYTSVKNQGSCGSCWAFSTAGMFESVLLKQGISTDLSEQWLVSCNTDGWGCNGGWFANSYYLNPGAVLESCARYKASDLPCTYSCPYPYVATGQGNAGTTAGAKTAIQTRGAVSCAVTVTSYFQAYSGGVFSYNSTASVNHAVVLVGWDDSLGSAGAWRMKNSWGSSWGESGMMWIEYGVSNINYGGNYLTY
jgi:hypothetical protein